MYITVSCFELLCHSNGVGRSGTFCGLFTLIEVTKMESVIDFFHKVKAMRIQRPGMVQTVVITNPFTFHFHDSSTYSCESISRISTYSCMRRSSPTSTRFRRTPISSDIIVNLWCHTVFFSCVY